MNKKVSLRGARVSWDQRRVLLEFMQAHADFARGRISCPDAARVKRALLEELSETLNALGSGATKTPEKWYKCWQDWKCDVKAKALRIRQSKDGMGGGPAPPLTPLEELLLQFWGEDKVPSISVMDPLEEFRAETPVLDMYRVEGVPDPLEQAAELEEATHSATVKVEVTSCPPNLDVQEEGEEPPRQKRARTESDPLAKSLAHQAAALDRLAGGMENLADAIRTGFKEVANALRAVATSVQQPQVTIIREDS